jgi:fumarate reductase subunit D
MPRRPIEPFLWSLFSAGGVLAALFIPAHLFLFGLAFPLGWLDAPDHARALALFGHPLARLYLFALLALPIFHWAHRFRYTLYDGLQIQHLNELVNPFCYGGAAAGTVFAAYVLWNLP